MLMGRLAATCAAMACAAPLAADTAAPEYYLDAIFAASTAERLAEFCSRIDVDLVASVQASNALLSQLEGDGIEGNAVFELSGIEAGVGARQAAFVARHGLDAPDEGRICAAADAEIMAESAIGALLVPAAHPMETDQ